MESAFSSYKDIAFLKLTSQWFLYPISPLAFVLVSDEYASDEVFDRVTGPTLVMIGMKDPVVPPVCGKVIYKGIKAKEKWLWKMKNGTHIDAYHHEDFVYRKKFTDFLDQNTTLRH